MPMSEEGLREFLNQRRVAHLATINKDSSPQVTPVWFEYYDGLFVIPSFRDRLKVKNILRDNRVTLVIADEAGARVVIVRGRAQIREEGAAETAMRLALRYVGEEEAEAVAREYMLNGPTVAIEITPLRVTSWDHNER